MIEKDDAGSPEAAYPSDRAEGVQLCLYPSGELLCLLRFIIILVPLLGWRRVDLILTLCFRSSLLKEKGRARVKTMEEKLIIAGTDV